MTSENKGLSLPCLFWFFLIITCTITIVYFYLLYFTAELSEISETV